MKLPELKQNLRTLNTNPVDLAVIEYVTPYKICVAALLHEYVRTHHMLLRILNFLFICNCFFVKQFVFSLRNDSYIGIL